MKKIFAVIVSALLIFGVSACTCTNQNQETEVAPADSTVVEAVDSAVVETADSTVVAGVPGEENVAL